MAKQLIPKPKTSKTSSAFDLGALSENTPLIVQFKAALERAAGQSIPYVTIGKVNRKTGESCRTVDLGLENGQKISLLIRSSGDVVRVYLNDKDLPLKGDLSPEYQETFKEGIAEIAGRVRDNQSTFNAQQAKQKATVPQPKDAQGRRPPQNTTQRRKQLAEQEAQVDQDIQKVSDSITHLKQQLEQLGEPVA